MLPEKRGAGTLYLEWAREKPRPWAEPGFMGSEDYATWDGGSAKEVHFKKKEHKTAYSKVGMS